ncbi:uncharacterized protein LOC144744982 [Ciona intestinalis]
MNISPSALFALILLSSQALVLDAVDVNAAFFFYKVRVNTGVGTSDLSAFNVAPTVSSAIAFLNDLPAFINNITSLESFKKSSFKCTCNTGYNGDGTTACADINECMVGSNTCHASATCTNTLGSFTCACNTGYTGNGTTCLDNNECTLATHSCHNLATCTNTAGSYTCTCNTGYNGDGTTACADINECMVGTNTCNASATCTNTLGSFTCACNTGYIGNGATCFDINECELGIHKCHPSAKCTNTAGAFTCACNPVGYSGNGLTCSDGAALTKTSRLWCAQQFSIV